MRTIRCVWDKYDSPVGDLLFFASEHGLCQIEFLTATKSMEEIMGQLRLKWEQQYLAPVNIEQHSQELTPYITQVNAYFRGERTTFDLPLQLYGTEFQKRVWQQLCHIPYGEVWSYKDVATAIGSPKAVRAVGGANNRNPISIIVPCHRVIGANRSLVGYGGGLDIKQRLLRLEGFEVKNQFVV